jgi:hypothetical protein
MPERYFLTVPLLIILHIFAGIASAGVSLTVGTIGFKLAPQKQSASFLSGASLATNLGAGIGPLLGGFLANFFSVRKLSLDLTWVDPTRTLNLGVFNLIGLDFLFILAFIVGLITLNMLVTVRERGEVDRDVVLGELRSQTRSALKSVSPVTSPNFISMFPLSFISRVPGMDVAIGVTAYQLADITKTITVTALNSGKSVVRLTRVLLDGMARLRKTRPLLGQNTEVARQAARGVLHASDETQVKAEQLARPAVVGIVRALDDAKTSPYSAIRGTACGIIEGASETGADLGRAANEAVAGARETARVLKLDEQLAVSQAVRGALGAAQKLGPDVFIQVRKSLPPNLVVKVSGYEKDCIDEPDTEDREG